MANEDEDERASTPRIVVDNEREFMRLRKKARRRLEQRNPNWTEDDLNEEIMLIVEEEEK